MRAYDSARTRRGSIATPKERRDNEGEVLPKIAHHLEKAGKALAAIEYYYRAGITLENNGLEGSGEMISELALVLRWPP